MITKLYLDLEGTIIEDIENPIFLNNNIEKISDLVKSANEIMIFSWAICNNNDAKKYQKVINSIEDRIDRLFDNIVFRDSMYGFFRQRFGNIESYEFDELCQCLGKEFVFQFFIRNIIKVSELTEYILIDDRVEDTLLECRVNGMLTKIKTTNIKEM